MSAEPNPNYERDVLYSQTTGNRRYTFRRGKWTLSVLNSTYTAKIGKESYYKSPFVSSDKIKPTFFEHRFLDYQSSFSGKHESPGFPGQYRYETERMALPAVYPPGYPLGKSSFSDVDTRALASFLEDGYSLSTELVESVETAQWLAKRAGDLFSLIIAVKRGKFSRRSRAVMNEFGIAIPKWNKTTSRTTELASRYLELRYAITPLVGTIEDLTNIYNHGLPDEGEVYLVGKASEKPRNKLLNEKLLEKSFKTSVDFGGAEYFGSSYPSAVGQIDYVWTGKSVLKTKLVAKLVDTEARARALLGMTNPQGVTAALELVPFSFVVGWAVKYEEYFTALAATSGLEFQHGYNSEFHSYKLETPVIIPVDPKSEMKVVSKGIWKGYRRTPLTKFPIPTIRVASPYSVPHVMDSLALARTMLWGDKKPYYKIGRGYYYA
jgi:hypothetical protein